MLSIKERFEKWEGGKAHLMKKNIETALLYVPYMETKTTIDSLKKDLLKESGQYQKLNVHKRKEGGAFLYCKLKLEESLEQLSGKEANEEQHLIALNEVLEEVFNNPYGNPQRQLEKVVNRINYLLEMDIEEISDKKNLKDSLLNLYMVMSLTLKLLQNLNSFLKWLIEKYLDLHELKQLIVNLLPSIEAKIINLEVYLLREDNLSDVKDSSEDQDPTVKSFSLLKKYFQQEFALLQDPYSLKKNFFAEINTKLHQMKEALNELIQAELKKERLIVNRNKMQSFIQAITEEKVQNQQNLFKLIHTHSPAFYFLMEQLPEQEKNKFMVQMNALQPQGSFKNWLEQWTPLRVQQALSMDLGKAEKACYLYLKNLAEQNRSQLDLDFEAIEKKSLVYQQKLFDQEEKNLVTKDTSYVLLQSVETAEKALQDFQRISDFLFGAVWHIHLINESTTILNDFINTQNNFLIKLLCFLAQFFEIFKTEKIATLNKAREVKKQLFFWKFEYQRALEKELNSILINPELEPELKNQLQKQIKEDLNNKIKILPGSFKNTTNLVPLITNLEKLYANKKRVSSADPALNNETKNSLAFTR